MKKSIGAPQLIALLLGMFLGRVLGAAIAHSTRGWRAAFVVLGVVLLGGPILLWNGTVSAKVIYGLSFFAGLLAERLPKARNPQD